MTRQRYRNVFYEIAGRENAVVRQKATPEGMLVAINDDIARYGFRIQATRRESDGVVCFAFVNTKEVRCAFTTRADGRMTLACGRCKRHTLAARNRQPPLAPIPTG